MNAALTSAPFPGRSCCAALATRFVPILAVIALAGCVPEAGTATGARAPSAPTPAPSGLSTAHTVENAKAVRDHSNALGTNAAIETADAAETTDAAHVGANAEEPVARTAPAVHPSDEHAHPDQRSHESWLGVSMRQTPQGVFVSGVLRGSPAATAGLRDGDRIVRVGGQAVSAPSDVADVVRSRAVGTRLDLDVRRGSETRMLYAVTIAKPEREEMIRKELVGHQAPSISELRTLQGSVVPSWNQLRGQVVVLEFWASWCVACRALAPTLNAWHDELVASGVQILGITMDPYEEAERASRELKFATFSDAEGDVTLSYQATALPTLVIVDRQGIVRDVMVGLDFERLPSFKQTLVELSSAQVSPLR